MLEVAQVAVCSDINTKHINTVLWMLEPVSTSRNQLAFKRLNWNRCSDTWYRRPGNGLSVVNTQLLTIKLFVCQAF